MTDQIDADAPYAEANGSAPAKAGPIAHWPGELVSLDAGTEVFVRTAPAAPRAEPAIFVHGLGGSATNWTDLMGLLSQPAGDTTPLASEALDLPGFGFSPAPADGDYSLDAQLAAVIALIEKRRIWPVHLVGNSLGGAISTRLAARRPDLVRTLTLISPALPDLRPRLLPLRLALVSTPGLGPWLLNRAIRIPAEKRSAQAFRDLYADPSLLPAERRARAIAEMVRRDGLEHAGDALIRSGRALVAEYARPGPQSLWRDAARVTAPTLVIHGSHDRLVNPAMSGKAARAFRYGRVVVLPRTGHVAMMERPDLVAGEMREFVAAAARATAGGRSQLHSVGG
jgi:pimeloyl-ACP methyl ester carboxylesterase